MKKRLIKKLQEIVKFKSINSLGNIYPNDIMEWLELSSIETKDFIDYLHEQRVITYKYRIKCRCGEVCTVYEPMLLQNGGTYCETCGCKFLVEELKDIAKVVYDINKEELLEMDNEDVDFMVLPSIGKETVPILQKQEVGKMEIFLGSSSEAADYMVEIAAHLEKMGTSALMWNSPGKGIFVASSNTIDALIDITKRVQAAVFIFNADDKIWNDKSALNGYTVRDNVLFEYGLFMGALGKDKVCFVCKGNPKEVSDLKGITYIDGDLGEAQVQLKLKDWVKMIRE